MKYEYITSRKEYISNLLVLISVGACILIFVRGADYLVGSVKAARILNEAASQGKFNLNDTERFLSKGREVAGELKKKNLFVPAEKKVNPVTQVKGILGNEVFINGEFRKAGDMVGDAKVVSVEPTCVRIEWNGQVEVYSPMDTTGNQRSGPGGQAGQTQRPEGRTEGRFGRGDRGSNGGRGSRGDSNMSNEERDRTREQYRNMTPEQRDEFRRSREGRGSGRSGRN